MAGCGIMAFQDLKDREVSWVLFPFLAITLAVLHIHQVDMLPFATAILINSLLVSCILFTLWMATRFVFRKKFLNESFGLGDMLFFYVLAMGFPTLTFIYILVGSIAFSILGFVFMKLFLKSTTVPLAGLMGFFLIAVLTISLFPGSPSLYAM